MLSKRALEISPSPTLAIGAKANELKKQGIDVVGFGAGEPDFDTPQNIKDVAIKAINEGFTKYTPASGTKELKEVICKKFKDDNGLDYSPDQIVVSNGAKHCLTNIFTALLDPGDEVIIPAPYWVSYSEIVKLKEGKVVIAETEEKDHFKVTKEILKKCLSKRTKAIIINSPNNPTGQVYRKSELAEIASFAAENNLYVISDEIYEKLIYNDEHVSIASLGKSIKDLTIIVNGVSKTYSMTGWRIGYTASSSELAQAMGSIQSHETSNPNSIAQKAAEEAIAGSQHSVATMKKAFEERRNYIFERINSMEYLSAIEPQGAFYLFVNVAPALGKKYKDKKIDSVEDFAMLLLEDFKTTVVPGDGFGAPTYMRLSYATSMESIKKGLDRIEEFVNDIK